jgi:competence protein ComEC
MHWYGHYISDSVVIKARITEPLTDKNNSYRFSAEVIEVMKNQKSNFTKGEVSFYLSKSEGQVLPAVNDLIYFKKELVPILNSSNPGHFNYQAYLQRKHIYHQVFLKANEFMRLPAEPGLTFKDFLFRARERIINILKSHFKDARILGIAEALLIGYKNDLDKDLVKAYSITGIVHIIAISGLHLGLIYWMLAFIFNHIKGFNKLRLFKFITITASLWLFAVLTGGSASVLRSAVMFTFIILGKEFFRSASVYNSVACSAFMLLCYDPYMLWDVGFQLSYIAVIGIIWLQRPIEKCLFIENNLIRKLWSMASVTIAAQITAFPICIFYFNQFPNLFLIANMVEVPISTIVLFAEIVLIIFSAISFLAHPIALLISALISFMNSFAEWLAEIPFSNWSNIHASILSTCLLYMVIYAVVNWTQGKGFSRLKYIIYFFTAWLISLSMIDIANLARRQLVIYNLPRRSYAEAILGTKFIQFSAKDSLISSEALMQPHLYFGLSADPEKNLPISKSVNQFFKIGDLRVLWINGNPQDTVVEKADLLIISNNPKITIGRLNRICRPKQIVFDNSNSLWKIEKWKTECEELFLPCHSTREQGAFIINIP